MTYDYSDGTVPEYIGLYLDDNPEASWTDILHHLTSQYAEYISAAGAARELFRIREGDIALNLAKDAVNRDRETVQTNWWSIIQTIRNIFVRIDTDRAAPTTLAETFEMA